MTPLKICPIFIFSLPRSGSTLVQRVLAGHPEISTVSEPWILLPFIYARREHGARAEYWHQSSAEAIDDFCGELRGGESDYYQALREFSLRLYERAADGASKYFVDKTPHYHLVAQELMSLFPDGKFVFLWRNPLSVLASYLETFRAGRWQPDYIRMDLFKGVDNLVTAWTEGGESVHAVRYEDLLAADDSAWVQLFSYLELEFDTQMLSRLPEIELRGRYGDPTGTKRYPNLSAEPLEKWKSTAEGRVRKAWCRWYLHRLGQGRLKAMGYDLSQLLAELEEVVPSEPALLDLMHLSISFVHQAWKDVAITTPETPWPLGDAFHPPPPMHDRVRVRLGLVRAARSPR